MSALDADQRARREVLAQQLAQTAEGVREIENGYIFNYQMSGSTWLAAAEFVDLERRCCSFFEFTLEMAPSANTMSLRLRGGEGAKEFLTAQLVGELTESQ